MLQLPVEADDTNGLANAPNELLLSVPDSVVIVVRGETTFGERILVVVDEV